MARADRTDQVAGTWLAIASLLIIATLVLHGPIAPDLGDQMKRVAEGPVRWAVAHWIAAAAFSLLVVTGLVVLSSRSRLTASSSTLTAWAVVSVGALWTMTTAVAEATVVAAAAAAGNMGTFEAWWAFAEGKATGFAFVALAVAAIARNEAQSSERIAPAWSAWIAMVAGVVSFAGWALGMWFDVGFGSHLWVASSILMSVWTVWFGVELMRSQADGV
jgi:hypothetical protein